LQLTDTTGLEIAPVAIEAMDLFFAAIILFVIGVL
jgi:hypothetical protein